MVNHSGSWLKVAAPTIRHGRLQAELLAARCKELGLKPLARIVGATTFSREPEWFTIAPVGALEKLLEKVGWTVANTDLFEINEAFAAVTMAAEHAPGDSRREGEHLRRRRGAGASDRLQRSAGPRHPAERAQADRGPAWDRLPLRRRRRGGCTGRRDARLIDPSEPLGRLDDDVR